MTAVLPDPDWWRRAVVYQVYPRSFADSNGDGIGDLRGIIDHLDHLALLGVDVLWLSPVYRSPMDDNGYDISDYEDVDPVFGTLADLDDLIAGLHDRGIRLMMDLVVNHTSDEHPWFVESRSSRDNPQRDWYVWRTPAPGGGPPNDWQSFFSGPAWELDETTGDYYLHLFSRKQPDLNWENPQVREAVFAMMRRWVERGVDGFRMDVIDMISKAYDARPPYFLNGPRLHEFLQQMHAAVIGPARDAGRPMITVGETPGASVRDALLFTDPARREVDMVFTFEHMMLDQMPGGTKWDLQPLHLPDLKANLAAWQTGLADRGWNSLYWCNHDQPRVVSRWGDDGAHRVASAKAWATVLHLLRGTPYVYQGEEIGMTGAGFTRLEQYADIEALRYAADAAVRGVPEEQVLASLATKGRDNARTPVSWDGTEHAGFTTGTPWLPVNQNSAEVNVAAAVADPGSVLHHYRRLIDLRHTEPVVVDGDFRLLLPEHLQVFGYVRTLGAERLLVLVNCSGAEAAVDLGPDAALLDGTVMLGDDTPWTGSLAPWAQRVVHTAR